MTHQDAFEIQQYLAELEFPSLYEKALQFALFKTYGFPTMSSLLVRTRQLTETTNATKRYADTVLLVTELMANPPTSPRTIASVARINYLHDHYRSRNLISNEDMLYTLGRFALEPISWIDRYEWRQLSDMERCAIGTFWKAIGDAMKIDYALLPSGPAASGTEEKNGSGWRDGLHWLDEVNAWSESYETTHMVPAESNRITAQHTTALLLWHIPRFLKPGGERVVAALMDERTRRAMMYPTPPRAYVSGVAWLLRVRRLVVRYCMPPRPSFLRRRDVEPEPDPRTGRYAFRQWLAHPWYVKPSWTERWGPGALWVRAFGGDVPGDQGGKYFPEGYRIEEVGPGAFRARGKGGMEEAKTAVGMALGTGDGGCPFLRMR
ncbi:MAG: hypothetical protein M1833_004212 [Piccolia ochrophora]|nr:MAG: hypothetical protein M1833_004212 [Piccolia ochrophora]